MQQKEYIILCLEDCSDWSNATTRRIVMQVRTTFFFGVLGAGVWGVGVVVSGIALHADGISGIAG